MNATLLGGLQISVKLMAVFAMLCDIGLLVPRLSASRPSAPRPPLGLPSGLLSALTSGVLGPLSAPRLLSKTISWDSTKWMNVLSQLNQLMQDGFNHMSYTFIARQHKIVASRIRI